MQGASTFMHDTETTRARLEKARDEYLEKRAELSEAHKDLQELRKTLSDNTRQAKVSSEQAEAAIRAARGKETTEAVEMQEMAIRKERHISVVERMIADQEPVVELLQIDSYGAHINYSRFLSQARWAACHNEIKEQAEALFSSEEAAPLMRLLPTLMGRVEESVYADPIRMAGYDIDAPNATGRGGSTAWHLSREEQKEVNAEVRTQQMAAIGELVSRHIAEPETDALAKLDDLLNPIEPLVCEVSGEKWGNSGVAVSRRRKELAYQLGEAAA